MALLDKYHSQLPTVVQGDTKKTAVGSSPPMKTLAANPMDPSAATHCVQGRVISHGHTAAYLKTAPRLAGREGSAGPHAALGETTAPFRLDLSLLETPTSRPHLISNPSPVVPCLPSFLRLRFGLPHSLRLLPVTLSIPFVPSLDATSSLTFNAVFSVLRTPDDLSPSCSSPRLPLFSPSWL